MKIGLIGLGTIGSGVVNILKNNSELITKRTGTTIEIKRVCDLDKTLAEKLNIEDIHTTDYKELINDEEIQLIIELIGGYEPARTIVLESLKNKKHVVTANKALLAKHGKEIFKAAKENQVNILFEAAVGGCIPIIRSIRESFAADKIHTVYGILNGTTNYILTKMEAGLTYEEALKQAQELGFAEADPTFDVEGMDAAQKLQLIAQLAFDTNINQEILTEGITKITKADIKYAKDMGYAIKLLGIAKNNNSEIELRVHPTMIPINHELAQVKNESNAIYITGENIDKSILYGKGAGSLPTATVVLGDVIDLASRKNTLTYNFEDKNIKKTSELGSRYYLRPRVTDKPGVFAKIAKILGENNIGISGALQKESGKETVPITIITYKAKEESILKAVEEINQLDFIQDKTVVIRIEDMD